MHAAFVLGFFSPVGKALEQKYAGALKARSVAFIGKNTPQQAFDLKRFKSEFFSRIADGSNDPILVLAAETRGLEWVKMQLEQIVQAGTDRAGARPISLRFFHDAQDPNPIVDLIDTFLPAPAAEGAQAETSETALRRFRGSGRILCVRGNNQTGYEEALRRANIRFGTFDDHFEEMPLTYGSNIGNVIRNAASHYVGLLYAWGELKYLQPKIKKHWSVLFQGDTPAAVVARFRQALEDAQKQIDHEEAEKEQGAPEHGP